MGGTDDNDVPEQTGDEALAALEYAQRTALPAVMDSCIDWVMLRRPDDPAEAVLEWAVRRLEAAGRGEWARERAAELAPPPVPPKSPESHVDIVWAPPPRPWDYVSCTHDALLLILDTAAERAQRPGECPPDQLKQACDAYREGLRLHAFVSHCEAEVFSACGEWALHQLHDASEHARDWAERLLPLVAAGAAGGAVTGRTAEELVRFSAAEARRLRRQDAVLRPVVDDDRVVGSGPPKMPFVLRMLGCDRCELECHAAPLVVATLCQRRPYDATRRYATAMQAALGLASYRAIGAAVRVSALRASPGYARLLQGEGLLDISIDDTL